MCSPSTHITSNQHIDFELCGVQKVAPCDERDGEPATTRRQKTASPPRHPAEHEYQSDTLSTNYQTRARRGKGHLFLRGIGTIERQNAGGGWAARHEQKDLTKKPRRRRARPRVGTGSHEPGCTVRFLSVWYSSSTDSLCTAQPVNRRRRGGGRNRWATTAGMGRDGAVACFRSLGSDSGANTRFCRVGHRGARGAGTGGERRGADARCPRPLSWANGGRPAGTWRSDKVGRCRGGGASRS